MTHWRKLREPPKYLGVWSIEEKDQPGKYRRPIVKIANVTSELVISAEKKNGERCILLWFEGMKKAMVCNATNGKTLESLYGVDVEGWIGKSCELTAASVKVQGKPTMSIRISSRRPSADGKAFDEGPVNEETRDQQDQAFGRGEQQGREVGEEG